MFAYFPFENKTFAVSPQTPHLFYKKLIENQTSLISKGKPSFPLWAEDETAKRG